MKVFLTIFFALFLAGIQAQTLTKSFNEPIIGDINGNVRLDTSGYLTGMPITLTGQNVNWDFSKLKTSSQPAITNYVSPSTQTESANYPGTTLIQDDQGSFFYLKSVTTPTTRTEILGLTISSVVANFSNSAIAAIYPISFGATSSDNMAGSAKITTINATCNGKLTYTADGTGTLTLADGVVYKNVIRLKSVLTLTATQFFFTLGTLKQITYDYYDTSEKFPVLSINYAELIVLGGTPSLSAVASGNSKSFTGVNNIENNFASLNVFPNPSRDFVTISSGDQDPLGIQVTLYNALGQEVLRFESKENKVVLPLNGLPSGAYLAKITSGNKSAGRQIVVE